MNVLKGKTEFADIVQPKLENMLANGGSACMYDEQCLLKLSEVERTLRSR